ncbi:TrkH family potassium uptake protein [Streptomonospora mangrovi]|uniref:TrkH family potassium uptake protein n=1 Tax=Streptomonospora mangrovi TaxID=2883123 RepID=UPI0038CD112F
MHRLPGWGRPPQLTAAAFAGVVAIGTALLALPAATESGESAGWLNALFTATSAACVTGLIIVDTPAYWSTFGEIVILVLIQVGGLGIMSLATMLSLLVTRRVRLRQQVRTEAETKSLTLGDVRQVVAGIVVVTAVVEGAVAVLLSARFLLGYGEPLGRALYLGVFHAVSAFNNAGFALYTYNLEDFAGDPWILLPLAFAVVFGGLGFPVWVELWRHARRRRERHHWTVHAKLTLVTTAVLLVVGFVAFTALEWHNPRTMGPLSVAGKLLNGFFQAVVPRTAGFNSLPFGEMTTQTLFVTDALMFVGGGSAGTAGGIKVTTFALLAFVIYTNVRGETTVHVANRKVARSAIEQAITVVTMALGLVIVSTFCLLTMTTFTLDQILFEVVSAFATVGLSTGITADIPLAGQLILVFLMFAGRIGPITLASALALRRHPRRFEYPEERPIVG